MTLVSLLEQGQLWRGSQGELPQADQIESSGYRELDKRLTGNGWLRGQLIELLYAGEGRGELRLLWPLLKHFADDERPIFWIDPPYHPYPLSMLQAGIGLSAQHIVSTASNKERLWAIEQVLKSGSASLVLSWLDAGVSMSNLRRLQLAAQAGGGLGWVMRPEEVREQSSAAAYRVLLRSSGKRLELTLLKRKGGWSLPPFAMDLPEVS